MRKILTSILCLMLIFSITACSTNSNNQKEDKSNSTKITKEENKKDEMDVIPLGQTFKNDKYEITINSYEWTDKIEPKNPAEYYSFYNAEKGSTLLRINATVKNVGTDAVNIDGIAYQISINDKYNYKLQTAIDRNGDLGGLATVKPLEQVDAVIFTSIPNEAKDAMKTMNLYCGFNNGYDNQFDTYDSKENKVEFLLHK